MSTVIGRPDDETPKGTPEQEPEPDTAPETAPETEGTEPDIEEEPAEPEPEPEPEEPAEPEEPEPASEPEKPQPEPEPAAERREAPAPDPEERKRARRRTVASVGASLLVLAAIGAAMPFTPMMPVHGVNVDGNAALTPEEVEELTGIAPETPIGRVDVRAAAEGVAGNPWVKSATVKRDWPSAIQVDVEEYTAVAFVALDDGTHLIDAEGKDFLVADPPPGAMELVGPGIEDEEGKRAAVEIAASISEKARGQVEALDARGPYEYVLRLREGRTVVWGAAEDNANKALALESVLQMEGTEFNISNPELVTSR
ncbi:cell division protein FtsQ/DivIB [Corynebacterium sp. p3-SID1056]|uniref:cell division protein FtsQ/DivIB n=1 Tax=Corynebacterium sp. p3-SID1056 TaxID=2916092 RepID=UPI0021A7EBC2|nr:FtsQ-type POTRA domain-containing protein [Corynebacterium sp. p3-SID1056]MCT2337927.1 FtsQ-type POTRA domain-containing protein [Corynebacterium sp. p3-SID1056]